MRLTLRVRLTLISGGLFLVAGLALLAVTYLLLGRQIDRTGPKTLTADPGQAQQAESVTSGSGQSRQLYVVTSNGDLLTGADADRWVDEQAAALRDATTTSMLTQGAIALGAVATVAAGFGWLVTGRVLAPLHQVTDTARRIAAAPGSGAGLAERIHLRGPDDDVKELADTFDTMVERLDQSFHGQRRFVANASHELRTPLTLGRSLVEVAMHRRSASPDVQALGTRLLEINSRQEQLISGLLLLAKSDHGLGTRFPVDLADLVGHVIEQTAAEAGAAGVTVREDAAEAPTTGDALLLERLVHNLIENAVRHNTEPGGWVRVTSRTEGDRAELVVENTGPPVPADEIPALFEPFRRHAADRLVTDRGAGLGLSIVRSVATAHGGTVAAGPRPGGGLTVTVSLPAPWAVPRPIRS
ncbi:HAMP domain-containing sensor histidine kinase [Streptomyces sp. RFCAC02]|uniref:sensor histidine kinase n=1 Tax=Streptomyces sp. RFCAC02 TaxID=2499143 RepID=UPI00101F1F45|nr:HAMP domain-containing sensor histidine kinase [Streptomyces sp. RFCAC02]